MKRSHFLIGLLFFFLGGCQSQNPQSDILEKATGLSHVVFEFSLDEVQEKREGTIFSFEVMDLDSHPNEITSQTLSNRLIGQYQTIINFETNHFVGSYFDIRNDFFDSSIDVYFEGYQSVRNRLLHSLSAFGLEKIQVSESYSLTLERMKEQFLFYLNLIYGEELAQSFPLDESELELAIKKNDFDEESMRENNKMSWTEEDEAYLFFLRQVKDEIPIFNQERRISPPGRADFIPRMVVLLTQHGNYPVFHNVMKNFTPLATVEFIGKESALEILVEDLQQSLAIADIRFISMELVYISFDSETIRPAWVFGGIDNSYELPDNFFVVIDAETGEIRYD